MASINYQSDFKINEVSKIVDLTTPFKFAYFTNGLQIYNVSYDGVIYTNCRRLEDDSLLVIFDNHKLGVGRLRVKREYFLTDSDFADGVCNKVIIDNIDACLVAGADNCDKDITIEVYPAYQKGDDGSTPYIGDNGNWWIGDQDTGVAAAGSIENLSDEDKQEIAAMVDLSNYPTKEELEEAIETGSITVLDRITVGAVTIYKTTKTDDDGNEVEAGYIYTDRGNFYTSNGNIYTSNGDIYTSKGDIYTVNGDFVARGGTYYKGSGDDKVEVAYKDELEALASEEYVDNTIDQSIGNIGAYLATI